MSSLLIWCEGELNLGMRGTKPEIYGKGSVSINMKRDWLIEQKASRNQSKCIVIERKAKERRGSERRGEEEEEAANRELTGNQSVFYTSALNTLQIPRFRLKLHREGREREEWKKGGLRREGKWVKERQERKRSSMVVSTRAEGQRWHLCCCWLTCPDCNHQCWAELLTSAGTLLLFQESSCRRESGPLS
ncbi:unnamed protein product [Pleuronectes platessa]|uniref:Uncharacterized protein n=1 Tax=Pleuronectes platessa TaxID=8262 RepID=A0A9N7VDL3_PLEPL|nr:unnamed protein product [Pleuronectes platessa]